MRNLKYIHKIYLILIFSLLIFITASITINIYLQEKSYRSRLTSDLENVTNSITTLVRENYNLNDSSFHNYKLDPEFNDLNNTNGLITSILSLDGQILFQSGSQIVTEEIPPLEELKELITGGETQGIIQFQKAAKTGGSEKYLTYYTYITEPNWVVCTSVNLNTYYAALTKQVIVSLLLSVIILAIVIILTMFISNSFGKQLSELTKAIHDFSSKNFKVRAKVASNDEIGKLALLFNKMADTVAHLHATMQDKIEERTIALQHGNEELQLQNEEIEQQNEEIRAINDEMQAMNYDLQESERKTRRLIENLEDEYFFYSQQLDGKYIYVSPSIKTLLGYEPKEVEFGINPYLTDHPKNESAIEFTKKNQKGKKQAPFEIEIKDKHNHKKDFEILEVPVFDKSGNVIFIEGIAHEITERKRNEKIQELLAHISNAAMTSEDLEELIVIIRDQLSKILDTQNFYIAMYDEEKDMCTLPFLADENDDIQSFPIAQTMTGHVIKTKKSLLANETLQEEMVEKGIIKFVGTRSKIWLGVPLFSKEKVFGVLAVQSYNNLNAYNDKDRHILEIISNQISLSLERKKASENLKEEKDYAERILSVVPSAVFTVDKDQRITSWNKKAESISGWTAAETIGAECHKFALSPCTDNCGLYDDSIKKPITNRECTIKTKSGRILTIMKNVDYLRDANSNIIGGIESFEDITVRKRSELIQEITKNISNAVLLSDDLENLIQIIKDELHKLVDTQNFYIALYDDQTKMISFPFFINDKDKIEPYPLGKSLTSYVIRNKKSLLANIEKKKELAEKGELVYKGSLSKIWLGVPLLIENRIIGVVSVQSYEDENAYNEDDARVLEIISTQISLSIERKRVAQELKVTNIELSTQKEELQTTLDSLQETQSQLIQSEKMAALGQLIAGIAHEINTPLGAINASVGNMSDALNTAIDNLPKLLTSMTKEDLKFYLKLTKLADSISQEITSKERRQLKRELVKKLEEKNITEADKIAEMLIYMKINDNLDEIIPLLSSQNAPFVLSNARNIISLKKNTQNINMAVSKASKVVFALKKFAHRDYIGEKIESDIIDGIETVLTLYHNQIKHGVEVIKAFKPIPKVYCYPDEINQVWTNLFHNSLQAMNNKGKLTISADIDGEGVMINVSDTGSGIPEHLREKIFQPFFTTKIAGEGSVIGLDIVKKIIDKHEGKIDFESKIGEGTTFKIWLPLASKNNNE